MSLASERYQRVRELFHAACERDPADRSAFLDATCGEDDELRAEVESLLAHDQERSAQPREFESGIGLDLLTKAAAINGGGVLPERIGRYQVKRVLASGGMGTVYEAVQEHPRRAVAVKVMRLGVVSPSALRRFEYESQILARLRHPGIAQVYEAGTHGGAGGMPYFAMEYIPGARTITKYAEDEQLPTRRRLELFAEVCDAVQHGHQRGIVHRDLKPGNILVDETGQPKIIDFGIARVTDADMTIATLQTDAGQLVGTLQYMSPEQCAGVSTEVDTRCDVYALGVVLYELLSGELPYDLSSSSPFDAPRVIREQEPRRLSSISRALRGEVETIILKALEKDKTRRYQSTAELAADIRRYLRGEPIEAKSDSGWYVLGKTLARYRVAVAIAVAFVLLITASTIALGIMYRSQTLARQDAEQAQEAEIRQRRLAETNEARAKDEAEKAKAVTGLLQEMLSSASPYEVKGPDYTVRQLLDDFVAGLHDQLADQPDVEATMRQTVGNTYQALGLYREAEPQLRTALEIQRQQFGEEHPDVVNGRSQLAALLLATGETAEAEQHLRTALETARRLWGEEHQQVATILNNLGLALRAKGAYDEAESLLREALAMRRRLLGNEHEHVALSLNNLAVLLRIKGDYAGAEPLYREALAIRRRLLGNEHPEVAGSAHNLALLLHYRGEYDEAELLYREALAMHRKLLGDEHPDTATSLNSLAGLLTVRGDHDGAEPLFRQALAIRRKALPAEHPAVARSLSNLGSVLRDKGEYDEAEALYREALAIVRAALPEGHPVTVLRLERLALVLVDQGRHAEAETLLRECLEMRQAALPTGHRVIATTESILGGCLVLAGKYNEAEAMLLRSHEVLKDYPEEPTPAQRKALEENLRRIVQLYEVWNKPEKVAEWRAKRSATGSSQPSPNP